MPIKPKKASWQEALSDIITDPKELLILLELDLKLLEQAQWVAKLFPLKVPRGFVARMRKGDLHDPLLKQVLPIGAEAALIPGYEPDPLAEIAANAVPGLLHKYPGRVLVMPTGACAVHCRYCFRRHFPYAENNPGKSGWEKIFAYIANDSSITEVILSGGDPLTISDHLFKSFCEGLANISHIKTLRIHSRLPVVLPERISAEFLAVLSELKWQVVMVMHANHAQELDINVQNAVSALRQNGVHVLNQSVLLKGINDDVETLATLSQTLFAMGVMPYYLHLLDKVQSTAHFDVPLEMAIRLHQAITQKLPGYLVPKLVCEEPGKSAKTLLF